MRIKNIRLKQFRSYDDAVFTFEHGVNVIVGLNGTGKTNLLEAVYVVMHGLSFRVADKDLPLYGCDWFRLDAVFDSQERSIRYQATSSPAKQVIVNDGDKKRFMRSQRLPVVLFEPDMLRVLSGSPVRRRQLLDGFMAHWFHDGAVLLRRYERVLLQRNNILKAAYDMPAAALEDQLFAWDMSFAELAERIEGYRRTIIATINTSFTDTYSHISQKVQTAKVIYTTSTSPGKQLLSALQRHRRLDVARGYTTIGPHRSDFSILLNGQPAESTASRGEQRSLMLAIKHIEVRELEKLHSTAPIVLLDDVTSELDDRRRRLILDQLGAYQLIVTTTDVSRHDRAAHHVIAL